MSPVAVLLAVVVCYYAGPLFHDHALAHYVMSGALVAVLMCKIAQDNGRRWWPVCGYGAALGLTQSACGIGYDWETVGMMCDVSTGRPVSVLVGIGAILAGASLIRKGRG
jgi:hypothetical protein